MRKIISMKIQVVSMLIIGLMFGVVTTNAARPTADLEVEILGPANAMINSPYVYTVNVKNIGARRANGVQLNIAFPLTDTSPNRHILGDLTAIDNKCSRVGNSLECNLGRIRQNRSESISFNFSHPVSTKNLEIKAEIPNNNGENNLANNSDTVITPLTYPSIYLTSADILNSHCTGQNLTSYFECQLFPSSITSHTVKFEANGTITINQQGYSGNWHQPTPQQLSFTYDDGLNTVVSFNGYAVSSNCFEGLTTFPQNTMYVSPYKVCIQ